MTGGWSGQKPFPSAGAKLDFASRRLVAFHDRVAASIPCIPENANVRAKLQAMGLSELLITYLNFAGRSVPPRPRMVVYSPDFWSTPLARQIGGSVLAVAAKIAAGDDVNTFLSKDRKSGFVGNRLGLKFEPEKDLILNGFGYHHLHLQERGRGNDLVFVSFDRTSALMVMAGNHKSFMDGSVARAHARLQVLSDTHVKGVLPPGQVFDPKRQMLLARHGGSSLGHVNGKVTFGPMLMTSGHAMRHTRYAHHIIHILEDVEPKLENRSFVESIFQQLPDRLHDRPDFEWWMDATDLVLVDKVSRTGFVMWQGYC